jgi:FKBP-type peptidyl-prolyl cis-trans isomerase FkpA
MRFLIPGIAVVLFLSCNPQKEESPPFTSKEVDEEELLGNLYTYYVSAPKTPQEVEQNRIVEHCIQDTLNLRRNSSGLFYSTPVGGDGPKAQWGDLVRVHYRGFFLDGQLFDSSYQKGRPMTTYVGNGVRGWNESLQMMKPGSRMLSILPSHLAYGEAGLPPIVPPNSILKFEIELLEIVE